MTKAVRSSSLPPAPPQLCLERGEAWVIADLLPDRHTYRVLALGPLGVLRTTALARAVQACLHLAALAVGG